MQLIKRHLRGIALPPEKAASPSKKRATFLPSLVFVLVATHREPASTHQGTTNTMFTYWHDHNPGLRVSVDFIDTMQRGPEAPLYSDYLSLLIEYVAARLAVEGVNAILLLHALMEQLRAFVAKQDMSRIRAFLVSFFTQI